MQILRFVGRHNVVHGYQSIRFQLYSTSTPISTNSAHYCFANYLVDSLGFSHQQAVSVSTKFLKSSKVNDSRFLESAILESANSVVNLFKKHGFDETHLRKVVSKLPRLLSCKAELTLIPKFKFLREQGFSESDIIRVISANPTLLIFRVDSSILPAFQILRQFLGSHTYVIKVLVRLAVRQICTTVKNLLPNVALLRSNGIPIESIKKHFVRLPAYYMLDPKVFKDLTMRVEDKLGIARDSVAFLDGIALIRGHSEETLLSKCEIFKSFGWTQYEIETLMMKNANCFKYSVERIKERLDFLMNELQLEPAYFITRCCFFSCSLEKRILPRHKILLLLKEKGLLNQVPSLYGTIQLSEPCFLERFLLPFQEVHEVYAMHTGRSLQMLSKGVL